LSPLLYALLLIAALVLVWWVLRSRSGHRVDSRPAERLDTLAAWPPTATRVLTTVERQAYDVLRSALPAHMILAQVPLQRFIKVPTRNSYSEWLRRVGQLSADLLVCDRHSQVVAVVEIRSMDEAALSERAEKRRQRLAKVLKAADIPLHVWPASTLPTPAQAREAIAPAPVVPEPSPAAEVAALRSVPGRFPPAGTDRESAAEDVPEIREPPPSTWFDDLDTAPAPLSPAEPPKDNKDGRAAR
jgi:hypothetical protein